MSVFFSSAYAAKDTAEEKTSPLTEQSFSPWAESTLLAAYERGLLTEDYDLGADLSAPITREQFAHLMVELIALQKQCSLSQLAAEYDLAADKSEKPVSPFSDTYDEHIVLAAAMGLAQGYNGLYKPDDFITRCEAAALLYRCMSFLGRSDANTAPRIFEDVYEIPRWSVEAVKFCSGRTDEDGTPIMSGFNNLFSPLESYTIEQAVATLMRCESSLSIDSVSPNWQSAAGYDSVNIDLTFGGDCTFGSGIGFAYNGSFPEMYSKVTPDYFFGGIEEFFTDDLTMVNFEGTLTDATAHAIKTFCFKGSAEYAKALEAGSVDVVTVANNHSMDYLRRGFDDTLANLSPYVAVSGYELRPIINVKGVNIGFVSNVGWGFDSSQKTFIESSVADLKARGADLIVFNYHWGIERTYRSNATQQQIARYCIDNGADLVIGHHPHVTQEVETYKGKQIVYSLGNLVFGGNHNPNDKNCLIFRQSFTLWLDSRDITDSGSAAIPYKVSSVDYRNDYRPTKR